MAEYKGAGDTVTINDVLEVCGKYITNQESIDLINQAYDFIMEKHEGQKRKSGEPYTIHLIWVAYILATLQTGPATIAAGLLHDVMEDCGVSREEMVERFGEEITTLVEGVTKIGKMPFKDESDVYAENHRKIYIAMAKDIRVILIKFADRLHNMRTLQFMPPHKQKRISRETLEVYTPIAHRLGINDIKTELEDLSLSYLDPVAYSEISKLLATKQEERKESVAKMMASVKQILDDNSYQYRILGRAKSIYSIYKKMFVKKKRFDELYDLYALRIITQDKMDCYGILGLIHDQYRPIPGRFKDYIAMPKANMYQSIHTTVIGPKGNPVEVQIRTHEMHQIAEFGVAAHWAYKEGKAEKIETDELTKQVDWFHEIIELQDESYDASEFMQGVKEDIFSDKVYVFTPSGDVTELPKGSGPLDFAYSIHTEIGNKTTGAKVNGKMVQLDYVLKNGDIIEVLTSPNSFGPSRDWLKMVKTSKAKNKIKRFFKEQDREDNIIKGHDAVIKYMTEISFTPKEFLTKNKMAAVGYGEVSAQVVCNRLTEKERREQELERQRQEAEELLNQPAKKESEKMKVRHEGGIVIQGVDNLLIRLSRCCNPVPGDEIVGYITKGRGVSIHRADCPNVQHQEELAQRLIEVEWEDTEHSRKEYAADLEIYGYDRSGLLSDVLQVISSMTKNLVGVEARPSKDKMAQIHVTVKIQNLSHLKTIVDKIKSVPDVYSVRRTNG